MKKVNITCLFAVIWQFSLYLHLLQTYICSEKTDVSTAYDGNVICDWKKKSKKSIYTY